MEKMLYAKSSADDLVLPARDINAVCPQCLSEVVAKMGDIYAHHWAHVSAVMCDPWHSDETKWHLTWKSRFFPDCVERRIERGGVWHRADVLMPNDLVIEFQHSSISSADIEAREDFYRNMVWVLDLKEASESLEFTKDGDEFKMRWPYPKKSFYVANMPVALDLGDGQMFLVRRWASGCYFAWGRFISRDNFISRFARSTPDSLRGITFNDISEGRLEELGYRVKSFDADAEGHPWLPSITVEKTP